MILRAILPCYLCLAVALSAQERDAVAEADEVLGLVAEARALCAADPDGVPCKVADLRAVALIANAVAEAGRTRDRGLFLEPVRDLLRAGEPEIRASALYALAKLRPDAADTPALQALARDPVSNVRAGAWAAAGLSTDPAARLIVARVPDRPSSAGYGPDPAAHDGAALGFELPAGAQFLWLKAEQRRDGELHFLVPGAPNSVARGLAEKARSAPRSLPALMQSEPAIAGLVAPFANTDVYGGALVVDFAATAELPRRIVVVFQDRAFAQAGMAVLFEDQRDLRPRSATPVAAVAVPQPPDDGAVLDAAMLRMAGYRIDADPEESDLFMAILAAGGFGAADYLELYPEGAYAAEARALLHGPRIELDAASYTENSVVRVTFLNLPEGASASVQITSRADGRTVAGTHVADVSRGATLEPYGGLRPGVSLVTAQVSPRDGGTIVLVRDFSVEVALAVLEPDKVDYAPGEAITVRYSGMSGDTQDYISTAPAGSPDTRYLEYVYTNGALEGTATLTAPSDPGAYELRAFYREDESVIRARVPFTVRGRATSGIVPSVEAGQPHPDARASLAIEKSVYAPGEAILVTFAGMFGAQDDYVSTAPEGSGNATYLTYQYTRGALEGTATLFAPAAPGAYEVRAFYREDETILRGSVPFTVAGEATAVVPAGPSTPSPDARATLTIDKMVYAPGETITIGFSGMFGAHDDYVCTAPVGSTNWTYLSYKYTQGVREGALTLVAPTAPGDYEIRAFYREDESILRGSVPFTVR